MSAKSEDELQVLYDSARIAARISALGDQIARDYRSTSLTLVVIAEGARRFAEALAAELENRGGAADLVYVRARRTRQGTTLGDVTLEHLETEPLRGRQVLIVDDIADEGVTLEAVARLVRRAEPASVRCAVLISKLARRKVPIQLDYVGFELYDGWVVGFGMDLDGAYRELDYLAVVPG